MQSDSFSEREYQIIATLGPGSADPQIWPSLLDAGATAFRLNTSHLSAKETVEWLERLDRVLGSRRPVVILDLQGSKWRLGEMEVRELLRGESVALEPAETATPDAASQVGAGLGSDTAAAVLPVPHGDFFVAAGTGSGIIRLNDSRVELEIIDSSAERITCRVRRGGPVAPRKGISLPGATFRREGLLTKDRRIIAETCHRQEVAYAISYVRDGEEMALFRRAVAAAAPGKAAAVVGEEPQAEGRRDSATVPRVIGKLERPEAMAAAEEISDRADEVWVCRGDLGAEVGIAEMARLVHNFYPRIPGLPVPVVMAGQVLEHMTASPEPTRSEVCHLYDLLTAGFDGVVLSDEVAVGNDPAAACAAAAQFTITVADKKRGSQP